MEMRRVDEALGSYARSDFCDSVMKGWLFLSWHILSVKCILCVVHVSKMVPFASEHGIT